MKNNSIHDKKNDIKQKPGIIWFTYLIHNMCIFNCLRPDRTGYHSSSSMTLTMWIRWIKLLSTNEGKWHMRKSLCHQRDLDDDGLNIHILKQCIWIPDQSSIRNGWLKKSTLRHRKKTFQNNITYSTRIFFADFHLIVNICL